eukprot:6067534-Pleurochrysis_carterae.AAC.1
MFPAVPSAALKVRSTSHGRAWRRGDGKDRGVDGAQAVNRRAAGKHSAALLLRRWQGKGGPSGGALCA